MSDAYMLDPARSTVEFAVRHVYGLRRVRGRFTRFTGRLDLAREPAVTLTIDASSVDTGRVRRDRRLRSPRFLDATVYQEVRFVAETVDLQDERLTAAGWLDASGHRIALVVEATVARHDDHLELTARAAVDHRRLAMTWSPLGMVRAPSAVTVRAYLVPAGDRAAVAVPVA